jgi:hypothetical protein
MIFITIRRSNIKKNLRMFAMVLGSIGASSSKASQVQVYHPLETYNDSCGGTTTELPITKVVTCPVNPIPPTTSASRYVNTI